MARGEKAILERQQLAPTALLAVADSLGAHDGSVLCRAPNLGWTRFSMPSPMTKIGSTASPFGGSSSMSSILGGVAVGRDLTGSFALSAYGTAVRRSDQTYVAIDADRDTLIDVTQFILGGLDPCVVRLPIPIGMLRRGDLLVASDSPFSAYYVLKLEEDNSILALDAMARTDRALCPSR